MPNWCYTTYVMVGDKDEVDDLYGKLNSLIERDKPLLESDFGNEWLGNVVHLFGGDWNEIYCRGRLVNIDRSSEAMLCFGTETAWNDLPGVWDFVLRQYPSLSYYYMAEECGMNYYATNDAEGLYFDERFIVHQFDEGPCYFRREEEVYRHVAEKTSTLVADKEEMEKAIEAFNTSNGDDWIYVNEIEVVSVPK